MRGSPFKTALVLSGGAARALAHLGVIQELERHDLRVDMVIGTSMGAIVGGLYARAGRIEPVLSRIRGFLESDLFLKSVPMILDESQDFGPESLLNRMLWLFRKGAFYTQSLIRPTLVSEEDYTQIINSLIPECNIEDMKIPFAAVATDLLTGDEVVFNKGSLRAAVSASAAIPGILPAVRKPGRLLADGGWVDNIPVVPAVAMGAHFVLAVDAGLSLEGLGPPPVSAIETLFRCNEITRITLNSHRKSAADVLLRPRVHHIRPGDFPAMDQCIESGRQAFMNAVRLIRRKRFKRRCLSLCGLIHPARRCFEMHPFVFY